MKKVYFICILFCIVIACVAATNKMTFCDFLDNVDSGTVYALEDCLVRLGSSTCTIVDDGTTNSLVVSRSNWGYILGDGDASCQTTVTFARAWAATPDITAGCLGTTNAVPANRGDARTAPTLVCAGQTPTTTTVVIIATDVSGANISTNTCVLFTWKGRPPGDD